MESKVTGQDRGGVPAWAGWIFILMGTASLLIGLGFGVRSASLRFGMVRTEGTIVGRERQSGPRAGYLPLVAYKVDGKSYQCKGMVGSDPSRFETGQRVGVLYSAIQPSLGYVDTFFDRWLIPLAFGGGGLFLVGFGYVAMMTDGSPDQI
jgi:hypothetical protein